jgi:hypothetical protein
MEQIDMNMPVMGSTREWSFGYDVENVQRVQDYVRKHYAEEDYKMDFAGGEDVMNSLTIFKWEVPDWDLKELIWECDGEGHFEE